MLLLISVCSKLPPSVRNLRLQTPSPLPSGLLTANFRSDSIADACPTPPPSLLLARLSPLPDEDPVQAFASFCRRYELKKNVRFTVISTAEKAVRHSSRAHHATVWRLALRV